MKLNTRIVALTATTFLVVLTAAYLMFQWYKDDVLTGLGTLYAEQQLRYSRARSLQPLMRELALARKMADSPTIKAWARDEFDPVLRTAGLAQLEEYRRFFADGSVFLVIDESLNYYFNDRAQSFTGSERRYILDRGDPENQWYFGTIESGDAYRLNVDHDRKLGVTKVWINVVVRDGDEVLGIIGTGIDLTDFLERVVMSEQPGVVNVFIDEEGAIQAHDRIELIDFRTISKSPNQRRTIFDLLDNDAQREALADAMASIREGDYDSVGVVFADLGGRRHMVGIIDLPEIDWSGLVFMDAETLLGANRFLPFAGLILLSLALLSVLLVVMIERLISRPVLRLDAQMHKFAQGSLPDSGDSSSSEIGRLERSFAHMAEKVRGYTTELEHEVGERTRELDEKNRRLEQALADIRTLHGLLPTCMYCKKIRDENGDWYGMEEYITTHSEAQVSHGICPECKSRARRDMGLKQ